jgi:hypothetical protein
MFKGCATYEFTVIINETKPASYSLCRFIKFQVPARLSHNVGKQLQTCHVMFQKRESFMAYKALEPKQKLSCNDQAENNFHNSH